MGYLLFLKALPWRLILIGAAIVTVLASLHVYGQKEYASGQSEVQNRWDAQSAGRAALAREAQDTDEAEHVRLQALADKGAVESVKAIAQVHADLDRAIASGDRLRDQIRALSAAHHPAASGLAPPSSDSDGFAVAAGGLLESCSAMAERSGGQAEGLAGQLRGLQTYVNEVALKEGIRP